MTKAWTSMTATVAGSAVFQGDDYVETINALRP